MKAFRMAAAGLALLCGAAAVSSIEAAEGDRKAKFGSVKVVKCSNAEGKIVCPKGVTAIANDLAAWTKGALEEAAWSCGPGKKESVAVEVYWDFDEGAAHVGPDTKALEKLPPCVKNQLVPGLLEAVPPIHFKAKTTDPNVDVRYVLKIALTLQA